MNRHKAFIRSCYESISKVVVTDVNNLTTNQREFPHIDDKFELIEGAYDESDFVTIKDTHPTQQSLTILIASRFKRSYLEIMDLLFETIRRYQDQPEYERMFSELRFHIVSDFDFSGYRQHQPLFDQYVQVIPFQSMRHTYALISDYHVCMSMITPAQTSAECELFFDYIGLGKTIWCIAPGGNWYEYCNDSPNHISSNFSVQSILDSIIQLYDNVDNDTRVSTDQLYSYQVSTNKLVKLLT